MKRLFDRAGSVGDCDQRVLLYRLPGFRPPFSVDRAGIVAPLREPFLHCTTSGLKATSLRMPATAAINAFTICIVPAGGRQIFPLTASSAD
jgi:hypothetical protein